MIETIRNELRKILPDSSHEKWLNSSLPQFNLKTPNQLIANNEMDKVLDLVHRLVDKYRKSSIDNKL